MPPRKKAVPDTTAPSLLDEPAPQPGGELAIIDSTGSAVALKSPAERSLLALNSKATEKELKKLVATTKDIIEIKDKDGRAQVHAAAQVLLKKRTGMKAKAAELTEDAKAYTKAVSEEAARLIKITEEEETRLFKMRDEWDTAEKEAEERRARAEAERKQMIMTELSDIRDRATYCQRMIRSAADTQAEFDRLNGYEVTEEFFAEMYNQAIELKRSTLETIKALLDERASAEEDEAARKKREEEERRQFEEDQANLRNSLRLQREKREREEADRVRIEAIKQRIAAIQMAPLSLMGKPATDIAAKADEYAAFVADESFAEFAKEASNAAATAATMLNGMHTQALMVEQAAAIAQADSDRKAAEAKVVEISRAALAKEQAEAQAKADEEARAAAQLKADEEARIAAANAVIEPEPLAAIPDEVTEDETIEQVAAEVTNEVISRMQFEEVAQPAAIEAPHIEADTESYAVPYTVLESEFIEAIEALMKTHNPDEIRALMESTLVAESEVIS